jgi:enoyl-CoA hydratase/carnithine racemase
MVPEMSVIVTEKRGHVALLTLARPDALNALGRAGDGDAFREACDAINRDREVRCVILTGAGKAFSAGGDVKAMKERTGAFAADAIAIYEGYKRNIHQIANAIYGLEVPCIAAVNGAAIGLGCDVACLADIRISSDRASFGATRPGEFRRNLPQTRSRAGRWRFLASAARDRDEQGL